ncbi:MAG: 3-hydroxyacyl-CoA dehydrogenase family protein, partial [Acidobacteria bacterium]|nr:3-hydroxyacyl-CoA dehydrogenase family protein [Acidobacteriota bacterium]
MAIRSAAVLGAGTMGAAIAAHFTNAGIPATLLDLVPPDLKRIHPSAFFTSSGPALITPGSFDEHLAAIASADIIVEAVTENLDIKRALWARALQHAKPTAVLATNTSGIPLRSICEGWAEDARRRFVGMHFFNPPRYLYLRELSPGPDTDPALMASLQHFGERALGKGVVVCKDTPNFIGNRIGAFFGSTVYKLMRELDLTIEEVDVLTGPVIGLPKSASFRLLDIVGLDVWKHVSQNLHDLAPSDPWRERFLPPAFLSEIIARGWLGDKTGQGFYRRNKDKSIDCIDWKTLEYHPTAKPKLPAVENAKLIEDLPTRLRTLCADTGKAGQFLRTLFTETWQYAAERLPEIAHSEADIDHAMQWGYAHTYGPFQIAEILGLRPAAPAVPSQTATVHTNAGASLKDLGDGCLLLEFHSKMNSLGAD